MDRLLESLLRRPGVLLLLSLPACTDTNGQASIDAMRTYIDLEQHSTSVQRAFEHKTSESDTLTLDLAKTKQH